MLNCWEGRRKYGEPIVDTSFFEPAVDTKTPHGRILLLPMHQLQNITIVLPSPRYFLPYIHILSLLLDDEKRKNRFTSLRHFAFERRKDENGKGGRGGRQEWKSSSFGLFSLSCFHSFTFFSKFVLFVNICKTFSSISFLSNIITPFSLKNGFPLHEAVEVSQRKEVIVCHQTHNPLCPFDNWPSLKWIQGSKFEALY